MRTGPMVIAHGGNSCDAPQNSRIAIESAIELGVDLIEFDVNITSDGVAVIFHGPSLKIAGRTENIHEITFAEARNLDIGSWKSPKFSDQRMMTLDEILGIAKDRVHLSIDVKPIETIPKIVEAVQRMEAIDQIVLCGCDLERAKIVWELDPRISVVLNIDDKLSELADQRSPLFEIEYVKQAAQNHLRSLNVNFDYVTRSLIRLAHLRGISVWAWTVDEIADINRMIEFGVDAIYTNYPKRLLDLLSKEQK